MCVTDRSVGEAHTDPIPSVRRTPAAQQPRRAWFNRSVAFQLSSHEVMRGIKVRDGRLVLRPSGPAMVTDLFHASVLGFVFAPLVLTGWWLLAPVALYLVVDKLAVIRTTVVADEHRVTVTNRWTRRRLPFHDIRTVSTTDARWWYRRPVLMGVDDDGIGWDYLLGTVVDRRGKAHWCDAVTSGRTADEGGIVDPPPAIMKMNALRRWIDVHQSGAATGEMGT